MATIRSRDTRPELTVRHHLHALGFRYRVSPKGMPGKPDIVLRKHKAVVFVHGCFWHGHHGCRYAKLPATRPEFWSEKISSNQKRDRETESQLRTLGWRTAVIWECALKLNRTAALKSLVDFIGSDRDAVEIFFS
ncbi:very short patch repair endonuclease [Luteimonas pelagia]